MEEIPANNTAPPIEALPGNARLELLTQIFYDLAKDSGPTQPESLALIQRGDSLRLVINEIMELSPPTATDRRVEILRTAYVETLFEKTKLLTPQERALHDDLSDNLQAEYVSSVVAKIAGVIDAQTTEDALQVRQLPSIVKGASFIEGKPLSMEDLAGNHLYLLIDTALKEHVRRRQLIDAHRTRSRFARLAGNRVLRLSVAGSVIAASLTPKLGFLPSKDDILTEDIDLGLRTLSGIIIGVDLPEVVRLKYLAIKHDKRTRELHDQLSATRDLSDLALRMAYGSSRRGGDGETDSVTGRSGTDDVAENIRRFKAMDTEFAHLNNDPGGKPYSGNQALGYAARLLIEREGQLFEIMDPHKKPSEQRQLYLDLCSQILTEDARRMKKGLNVTRIRRWVMRPLAVLPAIIVPSEVAAANDATTLGQGAVEILKSKTDDYSEED